MTISCKACKECKLAKADLTPALSKGEGEEKPLYFAVMSCLQLFQRLAGGIVEYIIHGTGC